MPRELGDVLKPLVKIGETPDGCWLWLGKINRRTGYGHKQFAGSTLLAHRWVYQIFHGWIPSGCVLNHLCSNRSCVNPKHLEAVSPAVNVRKGSNTKLTSEQVAEIKAQLPTLRWGGRRKLAEHYGVSVGLISDIKYGRAWVD